MPASTLYRPGENTVGQPVVASQAASSSTEPLATAAALEIYAQGGNAVDASVATSFVLFVAEPGSSTLAGQGHIVFRDGKTGEYYNWDAFAMAPSGASEDMYEWIPSPTLGGYRFNTVDEKNTTGHLSVAVPGILGGLHRMHAIGGQLPWEEVLRPALRLARDGFTVRSHLANALKNTWHRLSRFPEAAKTFGRPDGTPLTAGDRLVQSELADTIETIAREGIEPFYGGAIGAAIVDEIRSNGGVMAMSDLTTHYDRLVCERTPVIGTYRGYDVVSCAPTSAGGMLLVEMLNLLEGFQLGPDSAVEEYRSRLNPRANQVIIEAMKIAFADRKEHMGDPAFVDVDVDLFTSQDYADRRRPEMSTMGASSGTVVDSHDTTHHSHVDAMGNMVALTQSVGDAFGSCIVVPGTGLLMNNIMKILDPRPGHPNSVAPLKKPLSTMTPALVLKDSCPFLSLGSPSGTRIVNAVFQTIVNVIDFQMSVQAAVECPRVHWSGDELEVEGHFPDGTVEALTDLGYEPIAKPAWDRWLGSVEAVGATPVGDAMQLTAVGDPRRGAVPGGINAG